jgi:hypothetical protein
MKRLPFWAVLFALAPGVAAAEVLTFDDAFPGLDPLLRLGAAIDPSYGDTSEVNVNSAIRSDFGNTAVADQPVGFYDQYEGLGYGTGAPSGVAIPQEPGGAAEFSFMPSAGYAVTLSSFDVASYPNGESAINGGFAVFDGAWNVLWSNIETVSGDVRTIALDITSNNGLYLQWGYSNDIGVDNIAYSTAPIEATAVPLPAGALLLMTGVAIMAGGARRGRALGRLRASRAR